MLRSVLCSLFLSIACIAHPHALTIVNLADEKATFTISAACEERPLVADYPCGHTDSFTHEEIIGRLMRNKQWDGFIYLTVNGTTRTTLWILYEPRVKATYGSLEKAQSCKDFPVISTHIAEDNIVTHTITNAGGNKIVGTILPNEATHKVVIGYDPTESSRPVPASDTKIGAALGFVTSFVKDYAPETVNKYLPGAHKHYLISIALIPDDERCAGSGEVPEVVSPPASAAAKLGGRTHRSRHAQAMESAAACAGAGGAGSATATYEDSDDDAAIARREAHAALTARLPHIPEQRR